MASDDREIERKYLLRALPAGVTAHPSIEIDQGYIPGSKIRERVRRIDDGSSVRYVRTIKLGSGLDRFEFEEEATKVFFETVWPLTRGHRLRKRRYLVPVLGGLWEIDEFLDRELVLAELELSDPEDVVTLPPEIAAVLDREVTDDGAFSNYQLSR
jgi:Uncharacterized protein conserved in bacteria